MGPSSDSSLRTAFGDAANKIWAQAGLDIYFLPLETVTSSTFYNVTSGTGINSISSLSSAGGLGQSTDIHVINLWFVNQINSSANILGVTLQSIPTDGTFTLTQNGIVIANIALTRNGGKSASDTIAHEIGHSLGLNHTAFGALGQLNLMSSTTYPPRGMPDIYPDGGEYDQLTQAQISQARSVSFFVRPVTPFKYPPEIPILSNSQFSIVSGFRFTDTHAGEACTVEVSNDLKIWTSYFVYPPAAGGFEFLDPNSTNLSIRFYRVRIP